MKIDEFRDLLKKENETLWQINEFIVDAEELGYGEIELVVKTHDYMSKFVELKAVNPDKKTIARSRMKKIKVDTG